MVLPCTIRLGYLIARNSSSLPSLLIYTNFVLEKEIDGGVHVDNVALVFSKQQDESIQKPSKCFLSSHMLQLYELKHSFT